MIKKINALLLALATPAGAFDLGFPLDCTLGETCHIQQYVDHDAGPGAQDFTCGGLSYDGHDGTDFALPTQAAMAAGVAVLAAADGTVKGARDGIADLAPVISGKECGNGVVIDHGGGWETQYCHMKLGSIAVRVGDLVGRGMPLGQVGQSGLAEFPHMHLSVRRNGAEVDPFSPDGGTCGVPTDDLWQNPVAYQPGGLLALGLAPNVPEYAAIKAGLPSTDLPSAAPALVVWAYVFGTRPGDALLLSITGPDGSIITERVVFEKPQALAFRAVGRKLKTAGWPPGAYTGHASMLRGDTVLGSRSLTVQITP